MAHLERLDCLVHLQHLGHQEHQLAQFLLFLQLTQQSQGNQPGRQNPVVQGLLEVQLAQHLQEDQLDLVFQDCLEVLVVPEAHLDLVDQCHQLVLEVRRSLLDQSLQ